MSKWVRDPLAHDSLSRSTPSTAGRSRMPGLFLTRAAKNKNMWWQVRVFVVMGFGFKVRGGRGGC